MRTFWKVFLAAAIILWLVLAISVAVSKPEIGTALYCERVDGVVECEERP